MIAAGGKRKGALTHDKRDADKDAGKWDMFFLGTARQKQEKARLHNSAQETSLERKVSFLKRVALAALSRALSHSVDTVIGD
jgi:hypothetical protein